MKTLLYIFLFLISSQITAQDYTIRIAGMPPGNIDYESAKAARFITVSGPDNPTIMRFRIIYSQRGLESTATSYSANFTKDQRYIIDQIYRNGKLYIDKIRIKTDKGIFDLPGVTFKYSRYIDESLNLVILGGKSGGFITKEEILKDPYIRLNKDAGTVIGFSLSCLTPADITYTSKSNKFTEPMINTIKGSQSGWVFWISDIRIRKKDNNIMSANPVNFRLK